MVEETICTMFPIVSTKTALLDSHFAKGYGYFSRIWAGERQGEYAFVKQCLELALEEYQRSYEESGTVESVANLLGGLCLEYVLSVDEGAGRTEDADYTRECYETGMLLIDILKESKVYAELGEYYFALQFLIGMVSNGAGVEHNKAAGVELMKFLESLGNSYAVSFVEGCELAG